MSKKIQFSMGTMLADGLEFGYLQEVSIDFSFEEAVLHSGGTLWPVDVRVHGAEISGNAAYANITSVVFEKLLGGTRTKARNDLNKVTYPGTWQLSHEMITDGKAFTILLYKCRSNKLAVNLSRENHVIPNFDFKVYEDKSQEGKIGYIDAGEEMIGVLYAWGGNNYNQCNIPEFNEGFIAMSAGYEHSLGLKENNSIVGWGGNAYGQITVPDPNEKFIAVAAGGTHSLGLKLDSSIIAFGRNQVGQCNVPSPNTDFIDIKSEWTLSMGMKSDGTVVAWGENTDGQTNVPVGTYIDFDAGGFHGIALKSDGSVVCWGNDTYGQCTVPNPNENFTAVAAGWFHSIGLKSDGSVVCWGNDTYGQCTVPTPNTNFAKISGGGYYTMAMKNDDSILMWGDPDSNQLVVPLPNANWLAIEGGGYHCLALK